MLILEKYHCFFLTLMTLHDLTYRVHFQGAKRKYPTRSYDGAQCVLLLFQGAPNPCHSKNSTLLTTNMLYLTICNFVEF